MRKIGLACSLVILGACARDINNKEAVRQGVIQHLAARKNLDLDLSKIDVQVTSVSFRQNEADATVAFEPRGGSAAGGMQMKYTLERKGSEWVVKSKGEMTGSPHGAGNGLETPGGQPALPPGHPPLEPKGKAK